MSKEITYFMDLDGTLFDTNTLTRNRVSGKNLSTILLLRNFANIVISTGRSFNDQKVQQVLYQTNISDIIASSGAEVYINKQLVWKAIMEPQLVKEIAEYATLNKAIFVIFDSTGDTLYVNNKFERFVNRIMLSRKMKAIRLSKNFDVNKHSGVLKMAFIIKNVTNAKNLLNRFRLKFGSVTHSYLASSNYVIEITDAKANKGLALSKYCLLKNIDVKNTVHIGDSMSDSAVKGYAGKLVAMGNSTADLKAIADEIAPNSKPNGIYKYFVSKKKDKATEELASGGKHD